MPLTRAQKAAAAAKDQAWTESLQGFPIQDLPPELILDILVRAGAWPEDEGQPLGQEDRDEAHKGMLAYSALSLCRQFRDALLGSAQHMANLIVGVHGGCREAALVRVCRLGHAAATRYLLELPEGAPHADCLAGEALLSAVALGHEPIVRMLLEAPEGAARGDLRGGLPLLMSAACGHESIIRLLLGRSEHAPRGDVVSMALALSAERGNVSIVRLLLGCGMPQHAPHPVFFIGEARRRAVDNGHASIASLLAEYEEKLGGGADGGDGDGADGDDGGDNDGEGA